MVAPIVWGLIALAGIGGGAVALNEAEQATDALGRTLDKTTTLIKWGTVAGAAYASYRALDAAGVFK